MKILIVDDEKDYLDTIKLTLQTAFPNVNIQTASNGQTAINICQNENIDLLLLDLNMPRVSGTMVAQTLYKSKRTKHIQIIFVTANSYTDFEKEGFKIGSVDYMSKPIEKHLLINRVGLHLTIIKQNILLKQANTKLKHKVHKVKDKNKMQEQMLIHQSKTSVMGEMIGAIAHQWRQPLNIIATSMINMETKAELDMLDFNEIKRINTKINNTLQFLSKTIDDFRNFFLSSKSKENIDIVKVIHSTINLVRTQFNAHNIVINFEYDEDIEYKTDGYFNELRQVILNLFSNSKDALEILMKKDNSIDGLIDIKLCIVDNDIEIVVCDNGGGIPDDIIKKIFVPYFTTKFVAQGTGIGLYLSKTIIEKLHNGEISVSSIDSGACFTINLPIDS